MFLLFFFIYFSLLFFLFLFNLSLFGWCVVWCLLCALSKRMWKCARVTQHINLVASLFFVTRSLCLHMQSEMNVFQWRWQVLSKCNYLLAAFFFLFSKKSWLSRHRLIFRTTHNHRRHQTKERQKTLRQIDLHWGAQETHTWNETTTRTG